MLFEHQFRVRTTVLWTLWFGLSMSYYAIFIYLPTLISLKGYDMNSQWETILIITVFQLPGYFAAASLVEIIGRKQTLVIFLLGAFVSAIVMGYVDATKTPVIVTGSFTSFFMLGAWGCVYAYTPENYPTAIRGIGAAYPSGFSRIGSFIGNCFFAAQYSGLSQGIFHYKANSGSTLLRIFDLATHARQKNASEFAHDRALIVSKGSLSNECSLLRLNPP
ncbi:unnamed protein product [Peronospora effusa]|uniref:Major facilitator superfamily (MFS) profile domain-containing protein n=1 Tax=Peronospora effusa TaxID=542832 RepID=A0A3M6VRX0_9STRA|nr:hypothetical protein DD238_003722 [Peronospora effusa]RQM12848.1 hypothetical protein DD237_005605 [Peronospora effusa]CAI5721647.1 unnamed protein product [Peronospora effusa]